MKRVRIALAFLVTLPGVGTAAAQRLIWLGTLPGGGHSEAAGVSADGRFVVGTATDAHGRLHAVRWQIDWNAERWDWVTIEDLGTADGLHSGAADVSADGSVVVGTVAYPDESVRAFRWHAATGEMKVLGTLGGPGSTARAVSADGRFMVGWAENSEGHRRPFRYDAMTGEMQDLGTLGGPGGWANDISADGRLVVGMAQDSVERYRAFLWDATTRAMQRLEVGAEEVATISPDGRYVGGFITEGRSVFPPLYVRFAVLFDLLTERRAVLDTLSEYVNYLYEPGDISSEGNLVVGWARNNFIYPPHQVAVLWRPWTGIEELNDTYADLLQDGSSLSTASAVSPDGRYILGQGYNAATGRNEAYLLDTGISTAVEEAAPVAVRLVVYDLLGRSVRTLLEGPLSVGTHEVVWDGRSDAGVRLPAGLYLLRLEANGQTQTRTITIVR